VDLNLELADEVQAVAARAGPKLDLLKWAVEHGAELISDTFRNLVQSGTIETLRWLIERGCPFNSTAWLGLPCKSPDKQKIPFELCRERLESPEEPKP
jgi:hypothetical protein